MGIQVQIERPIATTVVVTAFLGVMLSLMNAPASTPVEAQLVDTQQEQVRNTGGNDQAPQIVIRAAEDDIRRARAEHDLLMRQEQILRYQIDRLESQRMLLKSDLTPELDEEFRATLRDLVVLLEDKRRAEERILQGFRELWAARESALASAQIGKTNPDIYLMWPVEPFYGISATFDDPTYQELFGLPHKGIDIPALQGTTIVAADDGVIEDVVDNGFGFSYLLIRHDGYATLYGHVSEFLVTEGQKVQQGDPVARSGGMPGSRGAGNLSTGPHLHFEVITGEGNVNPLPYLPNTGVTVE